MDTKSLTVQRGEPQPDRCKRVLIAVDNSNPSHAALNVGGELAAALGAKVMLFHTVLPELGVVEMPRTQQLLDKMHREDGAQALERAARLLPQGLCVERTLTEGMPAEEIVDRAKQWHADFIVMGTRRRGRLSHFLLGSTAEAVIREAPCPVLTVGDDPDESRPDTRQAAALHEVLQAT